MNSPGQFERLIRLVQETGERIVVSFGTNKDPVVLLPLSVYERLAQHGGSSHSSEQREVGSREAASYSPHPPVQTQESIRHAAPFRQQFTPVASQSVRAPVLSSDEFSQDPADVWDGESGEEYDADRLFASASLQHAEFQKKPVQHSAHASLAPDRVKTSISQASQAYTALQHQGWRAGSGGQRLPIESAPFSGEERFSLGLG